MKNTGNVVTLVVLSWCFIGSVSTWASGLSSDTPTVRVDTGEIAGNYEYTNLSGRRLYSFLGVPYASPPVQNNRFKEPQPVKPWLGVWNATVPGSACLGLDYKSLEVSIIGQEDCLFLNVYTPKLPGDVDYGGPMNVVVHIHGGAFAGGQGIGFGPQYLLDDNDFVYVTMNYRLGVLGFASTGDSVMPGNNGMKDQVAALKWIQRNVGAFGGNSAAVTITGMSAGASSVHYHMVSPMSRGLFHRAILQSGSAFCHWSRAEQVAEKTKQVAKMFGCPTIDSQDMVKCLRSRPALAIAKSISYFMPWRLNPFTPFGPIVEPAREQKPFLPDIPEKLETYDVPVLISNTQDEGLIIAVFILSKDPMNELNNNWNEHIPHLLDYDYTISNESLRTKIAQDIRKFYFGDKLVSKETKSNLVKMISDRMFGYALSKAAQSIALKITSPVYFHEFGYIGKDSILSHFINLSSESLEGVCHGDETMYTLKMDGLSPHNNEEDSKMMKMMINIWTSFIKKGVPDTDNSYIWLPVSKRSTDTFRYIKITQNQTVEPREDSNHGNYAFWSSLPITEFYETNKISENPKHIEL